MWRESSVNATGRSLGLVVIGCGLSILEAVMLNLVYFIANLTC